MLHCDRFCIIIANCPSPHTTHFKNRTIPITFRTAIVCVLIWFGICTIPFAFRTAIICVLIWFRICSITLAFRRGAGLPLPLHQTFPFPQPSQKNIHPSLHTTLPPKKQKNPPFAINSGFFIFNSQQSSKWCPAVKQ